MIDFISQGIRAHTSQKRIALLTLNSSAFDNIQKGYIAGSKKEISKGEKKFAPEKKASSRIPEGEVEQELTRHERAQLLFIKNNLKSDPCKSYEVFNSMSEFAQGKVPQKELDRLVSDHHKQSKIEEAKLSKEKNQKPKN